MALSKDKKSEVIVEVSELLKSSKLTVVAKYQGTGVKALQQLRRDSKQSGTKVKVVKNRLVKQALASNDSLKDVDTTQLEGMLLYAFNSDDEIAPARDLNDFAKNNPSLQFVGAITPEGNFMEVDQVKALAELPSKDQMISGIINTLNSPVQGVISGLSGKLPAILSGLEANASS